MLPGESSRGSSSKKAEKAPKPSILKSMLTRDHSDADPILASELFRDETKKSSSSSKSSKPKTEKVLPKKIAEAETYTDEPDFSKFVSAYSEPVKEKKVEKKPPEKKPPDKKKEDKKKESVRKETPKKESKKPKSPVVESGRYVSRPIPTVPPFKTAFESTYDISMAEKQTKIAQLKGKELIEQEKWAQEKLKAHAGTCPMGYNWGRFKQNATHGQVEMEGYRCLGGNHFVTHELLAQGTGLVYKSTTLFAAHVSLITGEEIPIQTPFLGGQRWQGPFPSMDMSLPDEKEHESMMRATAQLLVPIMFGVNVHPSMIPQLEQQLVDQIKQEEKEDDKRFKKFASRPSSKGGPWWEDCS